MKLWFQDLGSILRKGRVEQSCRFEKAPEADDATLMAFLRELEGPDMFSQVEALIRSEFQLYSWMGGSAGIRTTYERHMERLVHNPTLADIMQFHGDGRIREKSLDLMEGPIDIPVVAYGLITRLNDWVPAVRDAARSALLRRWHPTQAKILAPAAWTVLRHGASWSRWQDGYAGFVDLAMKRPDVRELLVARLCGERASGTSSVFCALSRSPLLDPSLEEIASSARQPHLRAIALRCISTNLVSWPSGRQSRVWIDKVSGVFRNVPEMETRSLSTQHDLPTILRQSLKDRSAVVRRQALDELIGHRRDVRFKSLVFASFADLAHDPHPAVAGRLDYLRRSLDQV